MADAFSIYVRPADDERKGWICSFRRCGAEHTAVDPFPDAFRAAEWAVRCVSVLEADDIRAAAKAIQDDALKVKT